VITTKIRRFLVVVLVIPFLLTPISVETANAATCSNSDYGLTALCAAPSAQAIKDRTGTNTNGVYWISVNGVATQIYSIMDSAMNGGGWMLAMKGANTGNTFGYSANYWTTNNTLNPSNPEPNWGSTNTDAKYSIFNSMLASDIMAIFPDATPGGAITGQSYGYTWVEQMPTPSNTTTISGASNSVDYTGKTLLELFTDNTKIPIRNPAATTPYRATGSVFSSQAGYKFFGYNYRSTSSDSRYIKKVRWGFGWNNEGDEGSNDVTGGIGLDITTRTSTQWSAGDIPECCQDATGVNRQMKFEIYIKAFASAPSSVRNFELAGAPGTANLKWDIPSRLGGAALENYILEISRDGGSTWPDTATVSASDTSTTVSGLTDGTSYVFKIYGVNAYGDGAPNQIEWVAGSPDLPSNVTVVSGDETATVTWDTPSYSGTTAITDYSIEYSSNGTTWINVSHTASTARTINLTGLTNGLTYSVRIGGINSIGTGLKRSSASFIPAGVVIPRYESTTATNEGFTSVIPNFDPRFCWNVSATSGTGSVTPNWPTGLTPYMEFKASDYNATTKIWRDSSGNNRHTDPSFVTGNPILATTITNTNGSRCSFPVIQGGTGDVIRFNNPTFTSGNFTLFHVARYTGGSRGRIINGINNDWISGHWNSQAGVVHDYGWMTSTTGLTNVDNWVLSAQRSGDYRANGVNRTLTAAHTDTMPEIGVNTHGERSSYQVAEVIIFNRRLSDTETAQVEDYLGGQYGLTAYSFSSTSRLAQGKVTLHHVRGGDSTTATVSMKSVTPGFLDGSSSVSVTTNKSVPTKPLALSAIATSGQVTVSWIAPDVLGAPIDSYTVTAKTGGQMCTWIGGPLSCAVTGLPDTLDRYEVVAYNSEGASPVSNYIVAGTYKPVIETTTITAEGFSGRISNYVTSSDGVALSWSTSVNAGGTITNSFPNFSIVDVMGGETATVTINAASGTSAVRTGTSTLAIQTNKAPPTAPRAVSVTTSTNSATLTWTRPAIPGGPITSYTATAYPSGRTCTWSSGALGCTITGLPEIMETFTVTATNASGVGAASTAVTGGLYTPAFGTPTLTAEGFTVPISNYIEGLNWSISTTNTDAQISLNLPLTGTYSRYKASDFNSSTKTIPDSSGNNRSAATSSGTVSKVTHASGSNGVTQTFDVIQGDTGSRWDFKNPLFSESKFTMITFARYTGGSRGRIFTSIGYNYLTGFWNGAAGVAHHDGWVTNQTDRFGNNWLVSVDYAYNYRGNGVNYGTSGGTDYLPPMSINNTEQSDYQFAEVMFFDRKLSEAEIIKIEDYFAQVYGVTLGRSTANSYDPTASVTVSNVLGGTPVTINVTTSNPGTPPVAVRGAGADFSATVLRAIPTAVRQVATNPIDGGAEVTWVRPQIPGGTITSYTATATNAGRTCSWSTGALGCTITGLPNNTVETITVTATNVTGTSTPSSPVLVTPQKMPLSPVMTGFASTTVSRGSDSPGLAGTRYVNYHNDNPDWFATATKYNTTGTPVTSTNINRFTSNADNYSWLWTGFFKASTTGTYYFQTCSDDGSWVWVGANAKTGYTNSNALVNNGGGHGVQCAEGSISLTANTYYPIRITFGEGGGGDEITVNFKVPGGSYQSNGAGFYYLTEYVEYSGVEVSFNAPASNGAQAITEYIVTANTGETATGTSSPIFVGPLTKNTPYTFTIRARNAAGLGAISASSPSFTMLAPPDAPSNVTAKVDPAGMTISWSSAGGNITEYEIQKSSDSGSTWTSATTTIGTLTSVTVAGLTTGDTYLFRVRAKNVAGNSSYTATSTGVVQTGKPSAPTGLSAIGAGTSVVLGWTDPNPTGALVSTFNVQYSNNAGKTWNDFVHSPSTTAGITVTNLTNGNAYLFRVAAVNPSGVSNYSSSVSLSLGAPTAAPSSLSGRAGNQKVTLSWTAPALGTPNISAAVLSGLLGVATSTNLPGSIIPYARYEAINFNPLTKIWLDSSGNARNTQSGRITGTPTVVTTIENQNASTLSFKAVQGTPSDSIRFDNSILTDGNYTLFNVARYTGGSRGRIITSDYTNWLSGFWNNNSGVAYHNGWVTQVENRHETDWVLSTDFAQNYRSNGVSRGAGAGDSILPPLVINNGENSNFQIAEILIFDRKLTITEIEQVERYLAAKYGLTLGDSNSQVSNTSTPLATNFSARADAINNCSPILSSAVGVALGYQNGVCTIRFASTTVSEFTVPTGVGAINILVNGGGAGRGGTDSRPGGYSGPSGRVEGTIAVAAGDVLTMAPGSAGQNGIGCVSNTGGGAGGVNGLGYNGGNGGKAAPAGCSGGGGGGGAASVISAALASGSKIIIAGGAGGAAGGNNCDASTAAQNGQGIGNNSSRIYGSNGGFSNNGDGGGAGGGGGGAMAGNGGTMSAPCGEYLGTGGAAGTNSTNSIVTLASSYVNLNAQVNGFIQISYTPNIVQPEDYVIQYSSNNGSSWTTFLHETLTATSIDVTGLSGGTAYIFRVAAKNSVGQGNWSTVSSPYTPTGGSEVPKIVIPPLAGSTTGVTVEIPADAIPTTGSVSGSTIFQSNAGDGARIVKIETLADSGGITAVSTPIIIHLPIAVSGSVPAYSTDNINWIAIPQLPSRSMQKSQSIGYVRNDDGSIDIYTWSL
jgi:hypothetical protein